MTWKSTFSIIIPKAEKRKKMTRKEKAEKYFKSGYNCCQAVSCAFCEDFDISEQLMAKFAEGFGGGMGRSRSVCGAVSAMVMLSGLALSKGEAKDLETRKNVYEAVQKMLEEFKTSMGSVVCSELLGENLPKDNSAIPTPRDKTFYQKRCCADCVALAAEIAEKYLI